MGPMSMSTLRKYGVVLLANMAIPGLAFGATVVNPTTISFSGIVSEVRIEDNPITGPLDQRVFKITTTGPFNTLSGGFFAVGPDTFSGFQDVPFVVVGGDDTAFLTGNPDASSVGAIDNPQELSVDAAAYVADFAAGPLDIAVLTMPVGGSFEIRGSDQEAANLILINSSGNIVGRISGSYPVPEPSNIVILLSSGLLLLARRRIRMR